MSNKQGCIPTRYVFMVTAFFGLFHLYLMRMNLSVAIVAMVNSNASSGSGNGTGTGCLVSEPVYSNEQQIKKATGEFDWDPTTQNQILASFFYGYIILQFPGGRLADKIGGKYLIGFGMLMTSLLTLITPLAARWSYIALMVVRFLMGFVGGCCFPSMACMLSSWTPARERSLFNSIIFAGPFVGTVFAMVFAGLLSDSTFLGGWPSNFYVFGCSGLIWCVAWFTLISSKPENHPRISAEERDLIVNERGSCKNATALDIPWLAVFTSVPLYALIFTQWTHSFGQYLIMTQMPTYLTRILGFSVSESGLLNGVSYIFMSVTSLLAGLVADKLRSREIMGITNIRKMFDAISAIGPALCLLLITTSPCGRWEVVIFVWIAVACLGPQNAGFAITHVDMAPVFAGTIYGIANCIGNTTGFTAPAIVGAFTQNNFTIWAWSHVFYLTSGLMIVGTTIFAFFGSAEQQSWATYSDIKPEDEEKRRASIVF